MTFIACLTAHTGVVRKHHIFVSKGDLSCGYSVEETVWPVFPWSSTIHVFCIEQLVAMERCFIVNKQKVVIDRWIEWRPFTSGTCWMEQTALHYWHVCVVIGTVIEHNQAKKQPHFQVITNKHCAAQPVVYWRVNSLAPSLKKKLQWR